MRTAAEIEAHVYVMPDEEPVPRRVWNEYIRAQDCEENFTVRTKVEEAHDILCGLREENNELDYVIELLDAVLKYLSK